MHLSPEKFNKLISFLLLLVLLFGCIINDKENRPFLDDDTVNTFSIVGGDPVDGESEFDYVVSIYYGEVLLCTGTHLGDGFILTAAHCLLPIEFPGEFEDFLSSTSVKFSSGQAHKIEEFYVHQDYKAEFRGMFDLGILKLEASSYFNDYSQVRLPETELEEWEILTTEEELLIMGYGYRENILGGFLGQSSDKVGDLESAMIHIEDFSSTEVILSTPNVSACLGDSGGPLFKIDKSGNSIQVGVASRIRGICGGEFTRNYYTRLYHSYCWINKVIGKDRYQCRDDIDDYEYQLINSLFDDTSDVEELDLSGRLIKDLSFLSQFPNLKKINLSDNLIEDITGLEEFKLHRIDLGENYIKEETFEKWEFGDVTQILGRYEQYETHHKTLFYRTCSGEHTPSRDEELIYEELLWQTGLDEQNCYEAHQRLRNDPMFELEYQDIQSFDMLRDYSHFTMLALSGNQIEDLSFLSEMTFLESLYLDDNKIKDLAPLKELSSLIYLSLQNNPLDDFQSILELKINGPEHLVVNLGEIDQEMKNYCQQARLIMCL